MGTNYFAVDTSAVCSECGRCDDDARQHIGKSSVGWWFLFRGTDEIRSVQDWRDRLDSPDVQIEDEYGRAIDVGSFWAKVEAKASRPPHRGEEDLAREYTRVGIHAWIDETGHRFLKWEFS